MRVRYFASEEKLSSYLPGDIQWEFWRHGQEIGKYFLLICPIRLAEVFVSCESAWKKYFELHHPDCTFITAGFVEESHSNYIDLLEPPGDLAAFFRSAKKSGEEWEPIHSGGMDMTQALRRFFEGHGEESILEDFSHINRILKIAEDEISRHGTDFEELKLNLLAPNEVEQKWRSLKNLWNNYYPFFGCLPFYPLFQEADNLLSELEVFFENHCQLNLLKPMQCTQKLERISDLLTSCSRYA